MHMETPFHCRCEVGEKDKLGGRATANSGLRGEPGGSDESRRR